MSDHGFNFDKNRAFWIMVTWLLIFSVLGGFGWLGAVVWKTICLFGVM